MLGTSNKKMLEISYHVDFKDAMKHICHPTVCVVCLKKITEFDLKKCSGCKLAFYCGKEHQRLHWKKHKEFCKVVQLIMERAGKVGLYHDYENQCYSSYDSYRKELVFICTNLLDRLVNQEEYSLLANPFTCKICNTHKQDCMITCKNCCVISYCSKEHQKEDESTHSTVCNQLKDCLDCDIYLQTPFHLSACISDVSTLSSDIKTFIDECVTFKTKPHVNDWFIDRFISMSLTFPLTLIYILEKSNIDLTKEKLEVHIVGSGLLESRAWWCWEYVFHVFKNFKVLNLNFIGPECSLEFLPPVLSCESCVNYRSINYNLEKDLYHNYVKRVKEWPDIIVAYNCGFHETDFNDYYESWLPSMPALCSYPGSVVAFTSYMQHEAEVDFGVIGKFLVKDNVTVLAASQKNPFKCLVPLYDYHCQDRLIYYINNFISIIQM